MCGNIGMVLFILCLFTLSQLGNCNDFGCCDKIPIEEADCRNACHQMLLAGSPAEQLANVAASVNFCPGHSVELWECASKTVPVLQELNMFSGRPCCNFTRTKVCREACMNAKSEDDIANHCSRSTEDSKLYECLARQKDGEKCCNKAETYDNKSGYISEFCKATCWHMYLTNTLTSSESKRQLRHQCTGRNKDVVQCLQKQTRQTRQSNNVQSLHCCEKSTNMTCRRVCEEALSSNLKEDRKMDKLIQACGKVDLIKPLYTCLLKVDPSQSESQDVAGMDSAKLHCCEKASNKRCGNLCIQTNSKRWSMYFKFEHTCGYLSPSVSSMENKLHACLKDVEEPCHLGCSGLQYCTNMNNRPTELFRSCTSDADLAAKKDILMWQKGTISLPESIEIPVKDIRTCEPEMWKAIACTYQIKPCFKSPTPPQICQEDCVYLMSKCVDTSRRSHGVTELCNRLPSSSEGNCISLKHYTVESSFKSNNMEITHPCKPNPCPKDHICEINRRKCRHSRSCPHFVCKKGCKMGQLSVAMVPQNTNVLIPVYKNHDNAMRCLDYKVCHCSHNGNLGNCHNMQCLPKDSCRFRSGLVRAHGEHFQIDCNDCVCYAGKEVCTRRQCRNRLLLVESSNIGILSCDCDRRYDPVCASNGKTYPNQCVARCVGEQVIQKGACHNFDPCKGNPCEHDHRCVPHRQVCLGHDNKQCPQYTCLALYDCNEHRRRPVCDTNGKEYTNDCLLLSQDKDIAYKGHCVPKPCSMSGVVCGHDGETYVSECAAIAARVTVDYTGPCRAISYSDTSADLKRACTEIFCAPVTPAGCTGIIPPWSCCPVCAAELRILSSQDVALYASKALRQGPITLEDILGTLSKMITISECDVFGYLSLDEDIVVLLAPVVEKPTRLQVTACIKEAERIKYLIESRSYVFTSNILLTPLLYAPLRTPVLALSSGGAVIHTHPLFVTLTFVFSYFTHRILIDV